MNNQTTATTKSYDRMLNEISSNESNEVDRFWKWARLRNVSRVGTEATARITGRTVSIEKIDSEQLALQVSLEFMFL